MQKVQKVVAKNVPCPAWPLKDLGAVVVQGHPVASGKDVFRTDDKTITGGVWQCSPGAFDLTFTWDEMALLLEGEFTIQQAGGEAVHLKPGDFFFVPRGVRTRWIVRKAIKKIYFSRESRG